MRPRGRLFLQILDLGNGLPIILPVHIGQRCLSLPFLGFLHGLFLQRHQLIGKGCHRGVSVLALLLMLFSMISYSNVTQQLNEANEERYELTYNANRFMNGSSYLTEEVRAEKNST